jgi:NRAMP (natural resistance-associated macrophage protein)-like metal ion transporter
MQKLCDVKPAPGPIRNFCSKLGPGLITGASDDDPSGIGTYSIAGAQFGYAPLWIAWFSFPLMAVVQLMCAHLGMISGRGLGGLLRVHYGRWILWPACLLLVVANVVNIGADFGAMAAATGMVTGLPSYYFTPIYVAIMASLMAWSSYRRIADTFKWMALVLFAYVIAAFLAHPDWHKVLRASLLPHIELSTAYFSTLVAILGTTISPYLFFWQATLEVEEDRDKGKKTVASRQGATPEEKRDAGIDVTAGMFFSNLIMFFIILTTAATLNAHGVMRIETTQQAAEALRPLGGRATYLLFTLGIIGTGMLSVPVLAGSTACAIAEGARWRNSLENQPHRAPGLYAVLTAALLLGMALNYFGFSVVGMLFWSAVLNGVLAPPLIVLVILLSCKREVMGDHVASPLLRWLGWFTAALMAAASIAMFVTA